MNYNEAKLNYLLKFNELKDIDERLITTSARYSYWYASRILKGRFIRGEPAIATGGFWSYLYAWNVLKERFELGEPEIAKTILNKIPYNHFLKQQGINFELP